MKKRLIECFRQVFPTCTIPIPSITTDNNSAWSSLTSIQLITAVEKEFDIEIDLESIEKLNSFSAFLEEITK
jgi:acyl carrier protein